ncbi:MAG: hypothetical protein IAF38_09240 [Bacteroidia bacterium]|nr:hypothetical protein [Bacteroidia bacterium]
MKRTFSLKVISVFIVFMGANFYLFPQTEVKDSSSTTVIFDPEKDFIPPYIGDCIVTSSPPMCFTVFIGFPPEMSIQNKVELNRPRKMDCFR